MTRLAVVSAAWSLVIVVACEADPGSPTTTLGVVADASSESSIPETGPSDTHDEDAFAGQSSGESGAPMQDADACPRDDALADASGNDVAPDIGGDGSQSDSVSTGDYAGTWSGTTSQAQSISFVHDGNGIVEWQYGWVLPQCSSTTMTRFPAPVAVVDGRVDRTVPAGAGGVTTVMTIVFASPSVASGT